MPQYTVTMPAIMSARLYGSTWDARGPQNRWTITAGRYGDAGTSHRGFLRFGDWTIPGYANIVSATLRIYQYSASNSSGYTFTISGVKDNGDTSGDGSIWTGTNRNGATWDTTATNTVYLSSSGKWYTANILAIAQAWHAGSMDPTKGVCLYCGTMGSYKILRSHGDEAHCPYITIVYDVPSSIPTLDKAEYKLGETVNVSLQVNEDGATHKIECFAAGESAAFATQNLAAGVINAEISIPATTAFGAKFATALTTPLVVRVTTSVSGEVRGSMDVTATIGLPSDAAPTCTCTPTRTWVSGVASAAQIAAYVQTKSGVTFALSGTAKYGASIASYRLTIDGKVYTRTGNGSIAHSPITGSGSVGYTYVVVDSRGLERSYTGTITVLAWTAPKITAFAITRVTSSGAEALDGTYAMATIKATVSGLSVSGTQKNSIKYFIQYKAKDTDTWTNSDTIGLSATSVNQTWQLKKGGAAVGTFDDMTGYDFRLALSDIYATSYASSEMPTKEILLDIFHTNGRGIGIGMKCTGTESAPQFDCQYHAHFYGGLQVDGEVRGLARDAITAHLSGLVTSVVSGTDAAAQKIIPFDDLTCKIGTGLTLRSDGGIQIGAGIQYVRVSLSVYFNDGFTAGRIVHTAIRKGSALADGWARGRFMIPAADPYTTYTIAPTVFAVEQGDVIYGTFGVQTGRAGRISDGSWITVEAVG